MILTKARVKYQGWGTHPASYFCRKDWHHVSYEHYWSWYPKKPWRKVANNEVRRYKHKIPSGGWYKKIFDLKWTIT
jgi:hypothetical protein